MTTFQLGPFTSADGFDRAIDLDRADPLSGFRERYVFEDPELIYLDGNSLGRLSKRGRDIVDRVVGEEWGDRLIRSWNERWWELQLELGDDLAPIVGASPGEVIISDSTSVNLYKLAAAGLRDQPSRHKIVSDDLNFPSDLYVLQGVAAAAGGHLEVVPSDGLSGPLERLKAAIDDDTALVSLSHTSFKSGYTYDLADLTTTAHKAGALILWDLSHSVGAVPIDLNGANADLAVGCTYKYLNGGPGSPAFLYVRSELQAGLQNPITAWWGHAEPFSFDLDFRPVDGIRRFHTGTMPIISLAAIEAGIADVKEAGVPAVRAKSVGLTEFLIEQWEMHLVALGFELASPRDSAERGSHVSFTHLGAWPITRALIELGKVIPDFRAPDNLRLGLSPLYTSYLDVHTAVQRVREVVETGVQSEFVDSRLTVT